MRQERETTNKGQWLGWLPCRPLGLHPAEDPPKNHVECALELSSRTEGGDVCPRTPGPHRCPQGHKLPYLPGPRPRPFTGSASEGAQRQKDRKTMGPHLRWGNRGLPGSVGGHYTAVSWAAG